MAAGDLLTADFQVELRLVLMGSGTAYNITSLGGFGNPDAKTQDTNLAHRVGAVGGPDYFGPRVVTLDLEVIGSSASDAGTKLGSLLTAWATSVTDIALHVQLPGFGHISLDGRPRGLDVDIDTLVYGWCRAQGTFVALNPTITTVV